MEFNDNKAIYLQIADLICENIILSKWNPGDRVQSVRELAVSLEVNPNTVMRTFSYLQEKGILYNKRGVGNFITMEGFTKSKDLQKEEFITNEMPRFFKTMDVLNLSFKEMEKFYNEFIDQKSIKELESNDK